MSHVLDVLVIEDDPWFAEHHMRLLIEAGFAVRNARDGIEGIHELDTKLPDAVLLDLFLPGPNALVLLHEMQSYVDLHSVPIIMCTSSAPDITPGQLAAYGVTDVLDKGTMQPGDVIAAIKRALL